MPPNGAGHQQAILPITSEPMPSICRKLHAFGGGLSLYAQSPIGVGIGPLEVHVPRPASENPTSIPKLIRIGLPEDEEPSPA